MLNGRIFTWHPSKRRQLLGKFSALLVPCSFKVSLILCRCFYASYVPGCILNDNDDEKSVRATANDRMSAIGMALGCSFEACGCARQSHRLNSGIKMQSLRFCDWKWHFRNSVCFSLFLETMPVIDLYSESWKRRKFLLFTGTAPITQSIFLLNSRTTPFKKTMWLVRSQPQVTQKICNTIFGPKLVIRLIIINTCNRCSQRPIILVERCVKRCQRFRQKSTRFTCFAVRKHLFHLNSTRDFVFFE